MINIGLLGFGRTGKEVAREFLLDKSVNLSCVFKYHDTYEVGKDVGYLLGLKSSNVKMSLCENYENVLLQTKPDVIVDFAAKRSVLHYIDINVQHGVNLVICSTGYNKTQIDLIKSKAENIGILLAPNITMGINLLLKLSKIAKRNLPEADISIIETHHSAKQDISGTALKLADELQDTEDIKIGRQKDKPRVDNEIVIHKIRAGGIIGKHEIIFGNPFETITLIHRTVSRQAFGRGAVLASHWIKGKKGFYSMEDVIK